MSVRVIIRMFIAIIIRLRGRARPVPDLPTNGGNKLFVDSIMVLLYTINSNV